MLQRTHSFTHLFMYAFIYSFSVPTMFQALFWTQGRQSIKKQVKHRVCYMVISAVETDKSGKKYWA